MYLGMDKNRFNMEIRPYLTEISIGSQGIAFDRVDMDACADHYKRSNGRPRKKGGKRLWDDEEFQGSFKGAGSGTLTSKSEEKEFAKALAKAISKKRNNILLRGLKKSDKQLFMESGPKGHSGKLQQNT